MKMSLRLKLMIFTFCIVLLVGGTISLYVIYQVRQRILATFHRDCQDMTAMIAEVVVNDVYGLNLFALRQRLTDTQANPHIRYTYVTDVDGVVLADGTRANPRRDQRLADLFSTDMLRAGAWSSRIEDGILK